MAGSAVVLTASDEVPLLLRRFLDVQGAGSLLISRPQQNLYSKNLQARAEAIANHYSEGGNTAQTLKYSIMAADRNMAIHACDQAISNYKRVHDSLDIESGTDIERGSITEKIAACYRFSGRPQESIQQYQKALTLFESLGDDRTNGDASPIPL